MPKSYAKLYYHLVWATWRRSPFLTTDLQNHLYRYLGYQCEEYGYRLFEVNGTEDHIHLVIGLPASTRISDVVKQLKGSSSRVLNDAFDLDYQFKWQSGYGVFTVSRWDLEKITGYVRRQKEHHADASQDPEFEQIEDS